MCNERLYLGSKTSAMNYMASNTYFFEAYSSSRETQLITNHERWQAFF